MKLWLYLHFPSLQLDEMLSATAGEAFHGPGDNAQPDGAQPDKPPSDGPWAIVDTRQQALVQVNRQAIDQGVKTGMGLASAAVLCRQLQLVPYDPALEERKLKEIARWLYDVSADIVLQPPSGLLLGVNRMLRFYGGLNAYWRALERQLASLPYQYCAATGCTPLAARLLARAGHSCISDDEPLLRRYCDQRSIRETDLPLKQREKLERLGVRKVADLCRIPLKALSRRFDAEVVQYTGRLTGAIKHPLTYFQPPEHFEHHLELLYEIENTQVLQHPISRQLALLETFLRRRDCLCRHIEFRLHQRNGSSRQVKVGSAQAEYRAGQWLELTRLTLEQVTLDAPVYAITLKVNSTFAKTSQNEDLFAGRRGALSDQQLVSLLQARLGKDAVTGLRFEDDYRPECASRRGPALDTSSTSSKPFLRPSLLLAKPQALNEPVSITQGPERITTGWWDQKTSVRDYYIARKKNGQWCWVFRTPGNSSRHPWYLHGYFS